MTTAVLDSPQHWVPKKQHTSIYSKDQQQNIKREITDEVSGKHFHEQIEASLQQSKIDKIRYRSGVFYHQDRKKTVQDIRSHPSTIKEPVQPSNKTSKKQFVLTRVQQPISHSDSHPRRDILVRDAGYEAYLQKRINEDEKSDTKQIAIKLENETKERVVEQSTQTKTTTVDINPPQNTSPCLPQSPESPTDIQYIQPPISHSQSFPNNPQKQMHMKRKAIYLQQQKELMLRQRQREQQMIQKQHILYQKKLYVQKQYRIQQQMQRRQQSILKQQYQQRIQMQRWHQSRIEQQRKEEAYMRAHHQRVIGEQYAYPMRKHHPFQQSYYSAHQPSYYAHQQVYSPVRQQWYGNNRQLGRRGTDGVWYPYPDVQTPVKQNVHTPTNEERYATPVVNDKPMPSSMEHTESPPANTQTQRSMSPAKRVNCIQNQLEFYFSEFNLAKDPYMQNLMNNEGYVDVDLLMNFPRLQKLQASREIILEAAYHSFKLEVDKERIRATGIWYKFSIDRSQIDDIVDGVVNEWNAKQLVIEKRRLRKERERKSKEIDDDLKVNDIVVDVDVEENKMKNDGSVADDVIGNGTEGYSSVADVQGEERNAENIAVLQHSSSDDEDAVEIDID